MKISRMLVAAGALASTACGAGTTGTSSDVAAMQAYQALGQDVSSTVTTYQADTATLPDDTTCQAAHETYATRMAAMLDRMVEMSATMDEHMAEYDHAAPPDMACVAEVMAAEFERHHGAACAAPDLAADETEAAEHVDAMASLLEHQRVRYEDAGSMMRMIEVPVESTWNCQKNADGSFTINGETWTPGTPLPAAEGQEWGAEPQPWPMPHDGGTLRVGKLWRDG
jgi:hypothetical protein